MRTKNVVAASALAVACIGIGFAIAQEKACKIKKWSFTWTLYERDDTAVAIQHEPDRTVVTIRSGFNGVRLTGQQAQDVASALKQTDSMFDKLNGREAQETVEVGDYRVRFSSSVKVGFYISINEKDSFSSSAMLNREDAEPVSEQLADAVNKIQCIQKTIKP